ncbi:DUF2617 family protein [Prescottella subtropica]|uniref:DUF2617 family protein n=1 Tax=Prescottella subtropica TaxID=2545757 RepID=UPI0010F832C8|nr:DUF2617 family protein [Prescottella subtropica]
MSVHLLDVAPTDVAADALGLVLGAPAPDTLAELRLSDPVAGTVTLGVLGASHVVVAESGDTVFTEQVSCDAVASGGRRLPAAEQQDGYRFAARVEHVTETELRDRARDLRADAAADDWVCAGFPGDPDALTALTATADGGQWHWRTWHLYPGRGSGTVVTTESRWRP